MLGLGKSTLMTVGVVIVGVAIAAVFVIPYLNKKGVGK